MTKPRRGAGPLTCESFVRDLLPSLQDEMASHLDVYKSWENLATKIPEDFNHIFSKLEESSPLYTTMDIEFFRRSSFGPTKALLEDLGTQNCQIKHLIKLLVDINQISVANLLVTRICQQNQQQNGNVSCTHSIVVKEEVLSVVSGMPSNNLQQGQAPSCPIVVERFEVEKLQNQADIEKRLGALSVEDSGDCLPDMSYETLSKITDGFHTNSKLGEGGFAKVFLGTYERGKEVHKVAVKRLLKNNEEHMAHFKNELKMLTKYQHENILKVLGSCQDGALPCLVFEYIEHGSLEDKLYHFPLSVEIRLKIAIATARALDFLHDRRVVHRDVKTANILLDSDFTPKLCDFATSRELVSTSKQTAIVIGTQSYLAPEARDYIVVCSMDVYSFGIVLLELLTGLSSHDNNRQFVDLGSHVLNYCCKPDEDDDDDGEKTPATNSIVDLIDTRWGITWKPSLVEQWYDLADKCLKTDKDDRDNMKLVYEKLKNMKNENL